MRLPTILVLLCLSLPLSAAEVIKPAHDVTTLAQLDDAALAAQLPDDADLSKLNRQRRALAKGLYWTVRGTIKPLVTDQRS